MCQSLFLIRLQASGLPQVFSCEFCEVFKNAFFHRKHSAAASEKGTINLQKKAKKLR